MKAKLLACFFLSVGLSAFGAPAFPVFVKAVNNVSEMVALNVNDIQNQNIIIRGYASAADSDGALFQYNPISATLTNTTTIFKPTNYNGRWIRVELTTTNGSGSAGAGVAVYDNVTAMISGSVTNDGAVAVVLDQGALFTCDSAASTATTNLFKIYPTSIGLTTALGTWTRQVPNDDIQISWAGTVTRDTIQSALTLLNTEGNGATAWLPSGNSTNLDYTTTITIPDNVTLAGLPGAQLTQTPGQASATAFTLSGASNVKLESFALSMFPASANKAFSVANLTNCAIAGVTGLQPGEWGTIGTNVAGLHVFDALGRENTPEAFGAVRDGVLDNTPALQTWVNWGVAANKRLNVPPGAALDYSAITNFANLVILDETVSYHPVIRPADFRLGFGSPTNVIYLSGNDIYYTNATQSARGIVMKNAYPGYTKFMNAGYGTGGIDVFDGTARFGFLRMLPAPSFSYYQSDNAVVTNNPILTGAGFGTWDIGSAYAKTNQMNSGALIMKGSGWDTLNTNAAQVIVGTYHTPIQGTPGNYPTTILRWHMYAANGFGSTNNEFMTLRSDSGYTGTGTLFFSDDGTFKAAGGGGGIPSTIVGSGTSGRVPKFNGTTNLTDSLILEDNSNLVLGQQTELANTVTNGFVYLPTMNGIPVNPPQVFAGSAPIVVDAADNRLYVYPGNSWEPIGNIFTVDAGLANTLARFTDQNRLESSVLNISVAGALTQAESVTATNAITGGSIIAGSTNMVAALAGKEPTIGYTPVNKAGDTMTGTLTVTGFTNTALTASRFVATAADKSSTTTAASAALAATLSDETGTGAAVFGTSPTVTYVMPFTSATTRTVESKMEDMVSVLDFGIRNDGVAITQTNVDNLVVYLSTSFPHAKIFWPAGTYLLPNTLSLTNVRGFSFIGEGASAVQPKTRLRKNGTGAGDRGVLSLVSCIDFTVENIEFVVGGSGADQAVELMADVIPSLSCWNGTFKNCEIRRFSGIAEFTYAAFHIRDTIFTTIENCTFSFAAKAMRIGAAPGASSTYSDGNVNTCRIAGCNFFGDVERVNTTAMTWEGNFFELKTGASPTAPSVFTIAAPERVRNDTLSGNFCAPGPTDETRTFYIQGTNSLSGGLTAFNNVIANVAIGFNLTSGIADIYNNYSGQDNGTDTLVNIQSGATKVFARNNNVSVLTAAGGSEVTDATSGVYKQSPFGAISPNTTRGDITYRNATVNARLAIGAANRVLRSDGTDPSWSQVALATDVSGTLPVANGGSGITSGTSGGVLGYTASGTLASSAALGASELVLGGGAGATPTSLGTKGTTTTLLHGNAAGAPTFGAVSLTADVTGTLPIANGGTAATTAAAARVNLGNDIHRGIADANATLTSADRVVSWTSISAARVCTLPAANTLNAGQEFIIGDISGSVSSANTITITRVGADTIDGATTEVIATAYGKRRLISDGSSKWEFDKGVGRLSQAQTWTATQTFSKAVVQPSVALTDGANIATDASLGNYFRVTLAGNRTLDNPTNPSDGQKVMWELIQDGTGTRTLAYGAAFAFGTDITAATLTTTASKRDFLTCIYNSTAAKWYVIAFIKGY